MSLHTLGLAALLFFLWLLLSGHFDPLLLGLGIASSLLVVIIALRMDVVDQEGHPYHLKFKNLVRYWGWLLREIILANLDVSKRILSPDLPISPTIVRLPASQVSDLGRVIYANSITLTPGTVAINVSRLEIEVHALTTEAALQLERGEMDRRVSALEPRG